MQDQLHQEIVKCDTVVFAHPIYHSLMIGKIHTVNNEDELVRIDYIDINKQLIHSNYISVSKLLKIDEQVNIAKLNNTEFYI